MYVIHKERARRVKSQTALDLRALTKMSDLLSF